MIQELIRQVEIAREEESGLKEQANIEQTQFRSQIEIFADCSAPTFQVDATPLEISAPSEFAATVDEYLRLQNSLRDLNREISEGLRYLEAALGPDYAGSDECETIRLLGEELEALSEREDVRLECKHFQSGMKTRNACVCWCQHLPFQRSSAIRLLAMRELEQSKDYHSKMPWCPETGAHRQRDSASSRLIRC